MARHRTPPASPTHQVIVRSLYSLPNSAESARRSGPIIPQPSIWLATSRSKTLVGEERPQLLHHFQHNVPRADCRRKRPVGAAISVAVGEAETLGAVLREAEAGKWRGVRRPA